jgi:UDP-2,3-diacylglucosamine hydrolase
MTDSQQLIYFLSDAHLGTPDGEKSLVREKKLVDFLDQIKSHTSDLFILGDLFDFWFEYKHVVPRGFTRILGKLAEMADSGIRIHFFTGNHDLWLFSYLEEEIGLTLYRQATGITLNGKHFLLAHGDDMDEKDHKFRFIKGIFTNRFLQWAFARLHPNFAFWIARSWSRHSRLIHGTDPFKEENEAVVQFARKHLLNQGYDYIILGHRHVPVDFALDPDTRLIILGDWLNHFTYAVFDGTTLELKNLTP